MEIIVTDHTVRSVVVAPQDRVDAFSDGDMRQQLDQLLTEGAI